MNFFQKFLFTATLKRDGGQGVYAWGVDVMLKKRKSRQELPQKCYERHRPKGKAPPQRAIRAILRQCRL